LKKNEWKNRYICLFLGMILAILCIFFASMEAKSILHVSDLIPASASLITGVFQKYPHQCRRTDRNQAGVCETGGGPAPSAEWDDRNRAGDHHACSSAGEYRIL